MEKSYKIGIGISSFIKLEHRKKYLFDSLKSLFLSIEINRNNDQISSEKEHKPFESDYSKKYDILFYLVDDCSPINVISEIRERYPRIIIYRKDENEGISCSKNDQIKFFMENGVDIIILADDDNIYKKGFIDACLPVLNNHFLVAGHITNGYFLCFTPKVVQNIGYFVKTPYVYGGEHYEYIQRFLRLFDKTKSNLISSDLNLYVKNMFGSSSIQVDRELENMNKKFLNSEIRGYVPYHKT